MKKTNRILWGVILVALGVIIALNAFGITDINVFFDGWWTFIIIIPSMIGLITEKDKTGNLIALLVGVFLLLCCRDILSFSLLWKLLVPAIIIIVGLKLIFGGFFDSKSSTVLKKLKENGVELKSGTAIFSSDNMNFAGEVFDGAQLNAIFGGIKCDLTDAVLDKDCVINASAIFGGVDIIVPANINVKIKSTSLFGGVSDKSRKNSKDNSVTLYIDATALFGGVDVK